MYTTHTHTNNVSPSLSFSLPLAHMHTCVHTGFCLSLPTLPWFMSSSSYNQTIVIVSQLLALPVPSMLALVYPQIASAVIFHKSDSFKVLSCEKTLYWLFTAYFKKSKSLYLVFKDCYTMTLSEKEMATHSMFLPGESQGRGAWWAAVYGVAQSQTRLKWLSSSSIQWHSEKAMAPHPSTLAWKIPWTEEPGRLQSTGSLRVGHDWATSLSLFTFMHWRRKWQSTPVFLPGESQGWRSLVGCHLWGRTESDTTEVT